MAPPLAHWQREQIITLRESGYRICDICRRMGITKRTAYFWLRRFEEDGTIEAHRRAHFVRATTAEEDAAIIAAHSEDPFRTTRQTSTEYNVSLETVRRRLHAGGLHHRKPARKIPLTYQHKIDRISFCLEYYTFDYENDIIIFVDEKTFKSDKDGRKLLWRRNNERYEEINTLPNRMSVILNMSLK